MNEFKIMVLSIIGVIGSTIATWFGGWSTSLSTLIIFLVIDYLTGLIVAGVFKKSPKTETGGLQSNAGWEGICKKVGTIAIVLIAVRLDISLGLDFIKDTVIIAFIANETISIIENAGLMGIPIPQVITKAIDILKQKADSKGDINA